MTQLSLKSYLKTSQIFMIMPGECGKLHALCAFLRYMSYMSLCLTYISFVPLTVGAVRSKVNKESIKMARQGETAFLSAKDKSKSKFRIMWLLSNKILIANLRLTDSEDFAESAVSESRKETTKPW